MSSELDKVMLEYAREKSNDGGIQSIVTKTLNRLVIERDFSAQEACHQLLHMSMIECSRTFDSTNLPVDLTLQGSLELDPVELSNQMISIFFDKHEGMRAPSWRPTWNVSAIWKLISYFDMIKDYQ